MYIGLCFFIITAPSSATTDLSPSTATAVVPYSPPDATADSLSLVPATQAPGIYICIILWFEAFTRCTYAARVTVVILCACVCACVSVCMFPL